jgi:hypothetical protein
MFSTELVTSKYLKYQSAIALRTPALHRLTPPYIYHGSLQSSIVREPSGEGESSPFIIRLLD